MTDRLCSACGIRYPATPEFFPLAANGKGGIWGRKCKKCRLAAHKAWSNTPRGKKQVFANNRRKRTQHPLKYMVHSLRYNLAKRCRDKGWAVPIELANATFLAQHILKHPCCPICDAAYIIERKEFSGYHPRSPSIDRIDPNREGYVSNWAIICAHCNSQKSNATPEEHRRIADWMEWAKVFS